MDDKISIKGQEYKIIFEDNPRVDGSDALGYCNCEDYIICIKSGLPRQLEMQVFLHECFHALVYELGLYHTSLSDDIEHIIVDQFSEFITKNFNVRHK